MKAEIAIVLIVCGTALIALPPASDYLRNEQTVRLLEKPGATQAQVGSEMSSDYRLACWFTGCAMIGVAVIASLVTARRTLAEPERRTAPRDAEAHIDS